MKKEVNIAKNLTELKAEYASDFVSTMNEESAMSFYLIDNLRMMIGKKELDDLVDILKSKELSRNFIKEMVNKKMKNSSIDTFTCVKVTLEKFL